MRHRAATLACVAVASVLAACGGDDDGVPTGDVSKRAYVAEADRICAAGDREINRAGDEYFEGLGLKEGEEPSEQQIATFVEETVIPNVQGQLDELGELEAPEADADQINEIYDTAQDNLDELADDPVAAAGQDSNPFREANRLARAYGLEDCGS